MEFAQLKDTIAAITGRVIRLDRVGLQRLIRVNSLFSEDKIVANFSSMSEVFNSLTLKAASETPSQFDTDLRALEGTYAYRGRQISLDAYKAECKLTGLLILQEGKIIHEDYLCGTSPQDLRISWSMSKSIISLLLGVLIDKGRIAVDCLDAAITDHVPILRGSGYDDGVRLKHVLGMCSGVKFNEDYHDYHSDINRMGRVLAIGGSMDEFAASLVREFEPGRYFHYVSIDTHVVGMMIRALTGRDIATLLVEELLTPLGLERDPRIITDHYGEPFVLGGFNMTLRDYARIAAMVFNHGQWNGQEIVSKAWLERSTTAQNPPPMPAIANTPEGQFSYGMQWWIPHQAEPGELYGIGIYGQYMYLHRGTGSLIVQTAANPAFKDDNAQRIHDSLAFFRALAKTL